MYRPYMYAASTKNPTTTNPTTGVYMGLTEPYLEISNNTCTTTGSHNSCSELLTTMNINNCTTKNMMQLTGPGG
jgi:hypothetical protein